MNEYMALAIIATLGFISIVGSGLYACKFFLKSQERH